MNLPRHSEHSDQTAIDPLWRQNEMETWYGNISHLTNNHFGVEKKYEFVTL